MSINQNNKYAEKLKSHPVFQDQILRSDAEIKKIFDTTFQFCKELIVKFRIDKTTSLISFPYTIDISSQKSSSTNVITI